MIVDAHAHITYGLKGTTGSGPTRSLEYGKASWGTETLRFLPPMPAVTSFPPEVLLENMDWGGVEKAILLQGPFYGEANEAVADAVRRWPDRFLGAAYLDPWTSDAQTAFDRIAETGVFCAVKLECSVPSGLFGLHPNARLDDPQLVWLWDTLEKHSLVLTLDLGAVGSRSYQTEAVRQIAQAHPRLRIVVAHLGQPNTRVEADPHLWTLWQDQIRLGQLPNVWFDMSALVADLPNERYPYPSAARYLREAIDTIGVERIMWGSDQPGTLRHLTYRQYVELAIEHTGFLSTEEQGLFLGETALRVYGHLQ